ncbi:hypothetical protein BDN72DRAFT_898799 [Pluteus cervinus]|uniref:Uncharacterized protein n=1 Tax=Pluteus cervinus TaxID=181527 RepID=A0ACD3AQ26_9AGAR|nr:hypothetical protein BDN72DRAFT_898799 [Pluteus cervinus]
MNQETVVDDQITLRNIVSGTALACLIYESVLTFEDEHRRPITFMKCLFCFTRYFALVFQVCNQYVMAGPLARSSVGDHMCTRWFAFQTAGTQIQLWMVEVILLLRVYALYNRTYAIGVGLSFAFLAQLAVIVYSSILTFKQLVFDELCIPIYTPRPVLYWLASTFLLQVVVAVLTLAKQKIAVRDGWSTAPILVRVTRDGSRVFIAICGWYLNTHRDLPLLKEFFSGLLFAMITYSFMARVAVYIIFSWPVTILTVLGCRLILNMQSLQTDQVRPSMPVLTTDFDTSTNLNNETAYVVGGRINTHSTRYTFS